MYRWVVLLALAGCARDPVKHLDDGRYSVVACSEAGVTNPQVKAVRMADNYCHKTVQAAVVDRMDATSCADAPTAATLLVFTCR